MGRLTTLSTAKELPPVLKTGPVGPNGRCDTCGHTSRGQLKKAGGWKACKRCGKSHR